MGTATSKKDEELEPQAGGSFRDIDSKVYDAALENSLPELQHWLDLGAKPDAYHNKTNSYTAFIVACKKGNAECAQLLADSGCDYKNVPEVRAMDSTALTKI